MHLSTLTIVLLALSLAGCTHGDCIPPAQSVVVLPVGSDGEAIDGATATFTLLDAEPVACLTYGDRVECGNGVTPGEYEIHVEATEYAAEDLVVSVPEDAVFCGVISQERTVELGGAPCSTERLPSVLVEVVDGETLVDVVPTYSAEGLGYDEVSCDRLDLGRSACGWELSGNIVVVADSPDHPPVATSVTVAAGECHVVTESVTIDVQG